MVGADDPGEVGALGRAEERSESRLDECDHVEDPHAVGACHQQERQHERRAEQVGDDHHPLAVPAVDVGPGHESEQQCGKGDGDGRRGDGGRRSRQSLRREEQRQVRECVSEIGDGLACPHQAVIPDLEELSHAVVLELG